MLRPHRGSHDSGLTATGQLLTMPVVRPSQRDSHWHMAGYDIASLKGTQSHASGWPPGPVLTMERLWTPAASGPRPGSPVHRHSFNMDRPALAQPADAPEVPGHFRRGVSGHRGAGQGAPWSGVRGVGQGKDSFSSQVSSEPPVRARARQVRPSDTVVQKPHVRSSRLGAQEGKGPGVPSALHGSHKT